MAVTRHQRMSLPSASVIDSVIVPFRVAGGSPGWQVAGVAAAQRETGDRMDGGGRDNFQVSGLGHQVPGSGIQVQVRVRELSHRPISRWRVAASGGGWRAICHLSSVIDAVIYSALYSALHAVLYSALPLSLPIRQPLSANRHHLLRLLAFPPPTPIPTPLPSLPHHVLPLHSSASRRPDAA